jgi:Ras-related protein Rab-1A
MAKDADCHYSFTIVMAGEAGVGKSSLMKQFQNDTPSGSDDLMTASTINSDTCTKRMQIDGRHCELRIFDTAGFERFQSLTRSYYRHAAGVLLVFDITDRKSFYQIPIWIHRVTKSVTDNKPICILVGNKTDQEINREVGTREGQEMADTYNMDYVETSAHDCINVDEAFKTVAKQIYDAVENKEMIFKEGWNGVVIDRRTETSIYLEAPHDDQPLNNKQSKNKCSC